MKQRQWWHINTAGKAKPSRTPGQWVCDELKRIDSGEIKAQDSLYRSTVYVLREIRRTDRALYRQIELGAVPFIPHSTIPFEKQWRALRQKKSRALHLAAKAEKEAKEVTGERLKIMSAKARRYHLQAAECDKAIEALKNYPAPD